MNAMIQKIISLFLILLLLPIPVAKASPTCEDPTEKPILLGVSAIFYVTGATLVLGNPFGVATFVGVLFLEAGLGIARTCG